MEDDIPSRHCAPSAKAKGDFFCVLHFLESYGPPAVLLLVLVALLAPSFTSPLFAAAVQLPERGIFAAHLAPCPPQPVVLDTPHDVQHSKAPSVRLPQTLSVRLAPVFHPADFLALPCPVLPSQSPARTADGCAAQPLPGHHGPVHYALPPPAAA